MEQSGRAVSLASLAIAVGAVAVALLRGAEPTSFGPADVFWVAFFALSCVLASLMAGRRARVWFALLAFVFSGLQPWLLAGAIAFGLAVWLAQRDPAEAIGRTASVSGLACGALGSAALLRLPELGPTGGSAAVAALAAVPLWVSATARLRRNGRRTVLRLVGLLGAAVVIGSVTFGVTAALAGGSIRDALDDADDARIALDNGDREATLRELTSAVEGIERAEGLLGGWWNHPAEWIPIVAQHRRALASVTTAGTEMTAPLAALARQTNLGDALITDGVVNLDELSSVTEELEAVDRRLATARADLDGLRSVWLAPALQEQLDRGEVELAEADAVLTDGLDLLVAAPDLLGDVERQRWLLVFMTPAETRELGGLITNWALVETAAGSVTLTESGRIKDLGDQDVAGLSRPEDYPDEYVSYRLDRYFQNLSGTPDFPTAAQAIAEIFPQRGGESIDGVLAIDPFAVGALTAATGPVDIPGGDRSINGQELVDFLLEDQYDAFESLGEREAMLDAITTAVFTRITGEGLNPAAAWKHLQPMIEQRRIMMTTFDRELNEALDRIGLRGHFPPPVPGNDGIGVFIDAAIPRKLDGWLEQQVIYEVTPAAEGTQAALQISMTNTAPEGLDEYVAGELGDFNLSDDSPLPVSDSYNRVSIYSTGSVTEVRLDGEPIEFRTVEEYGRNRALFFVHTPHRETVKVTVRLDLTNATDSINVAPYVLDVWHQPLVQPTRWTVRIGGESERFDLVQERRVILDLPTDP